MRYSTAVIIFSILLLGDASSASCGVIPPALIRSTVYCIPLNIAASSASSNAQVMLAVNAYNYSSYLAGNLMNIYLYNSTGGYTVNAWIEGNVLNEQQTIGLNTVNDLAIWIYDPSHNVISTAADTNYRIGVGSLATDYFGGTNGIGEAPQLSGTYGQYDNGANVFMNYWNFAGTSLPAGLTTNGVGSYSVSNGITITSGSGANGYMVFGPQITYPAIEETLIPAAPSASTEYISVGESTTSFMAPDGVPYSGYSLEMPGSGSGLELRYEVSTGGGQVSAASLAYSTNSIYGIGWIATGNEQAYVNYNNKISSTDSSIAIGNYYPSIGVFASTNSAFFQWLRTRIYPPGGAMPATATGAISNISTEFTCTGYGWQSAVTFISGYVYQNKCNEILLVFVHTKLQSLAYVGNTVANLLQLGNSTVSGSLATNTMSLDSVMRIPVNWYFEYSYLGNTVMIMQQDNSTSGNSSTSSPVPAFPAFTIADMLALTSLLFLMIRFIFIKQHNNRWVIIHILCAVVMIFAAYFYIFPPISTETIGTQTITITAPQVQTTAPGFVMLITFTTLYVVVNFILAFKEFLDANVYKDSQ